MIKIIFFKDLNKRQQEAVEQTEGPVLIIAGPGSGKTRTLVARTLYLIVKNNIPPENIMVSTFTEKAAKDLISRVSDRLIQANIKANLFRCIALDPLLTERDDFM